MTVDHTYFYIVVDTQRERRTLKLTLNLARIENLKRVI